MAKTPVGVCQPSDDAFDGIPTESPVLAEEVSVPVAAKSSATHPGRVPSALASPSASKGGPMLLGQSPTNKDRAAVAVPRMSMRMSRGPTVASAPHWVPAPIVNMVRSSHFECGVATVILGNCFAIGIEADQLVNGDDATATQIAEHVFTVLFVCELLLRIVVCGWRRFVPCRGGSFAELFDAMLVFLTGVLPMWVLPFSGMNTDAQDSMRMFTVLRALRLGRVVRVLRSQWFQEVWVLLRGMIESMRMLFWTVVVIAFITYNFAIFGVVTIGTTVRSAIDDAMEKDDERLAEAASNLFKHVDSVASFMMTLVQVLTLDSWTDLVRRLNQFSPRAWIFFYVYVSLAVLVLMNIVTAVLVDNALSNSKKDAQEIVAAQEKEKQKAFMRFRSLFEDMDTDGSGDLSRDEFQEAFADPGICAQLRALKLEAEDVEEIFSLLDSGDGVLSLAEFFEGIQRMEGTATAKDLFRLLKKIDRLAVSISRQQTEAGSMSASRSALGAGDISSSTRNGAPASPCAGRGGFTQPSNAMLLQRLDTMATSMSGYDAKVDKCLAELSDVRASLNLITYSRMQT
mmetsp:Transcript_128059/g.370616  ORF Transcript_128059/g.370616 Transcript_128059/m.370616 type:complete len:571 (-) Transcript_128059:76-1788(-)|eukprot:CAMPEP_0176026908 /NCGR_PEP_ID=MMETSP0120_2-20121206/13190_1 /TAXON_ID=160619 /ORGANISM="Kryptoperidinium foliaceum, Strain CCMP 1326" /LENGTH=570 /DNA_ID=CAMNT_0017360113 /DNA_START=82 /DNA_END=1794 /DNA_ORIENTATION=+